MRWLLPFVALFAFACVGCQRDQPYKCFGGYRVHGYRIDFHAAALSQEFFESPAVDGQEACVDVVGGTNHLRIEGGKLSLNSRPRGTVNVGDRIEVTADGQLRVNDTLRGE